MRRGLERDEVAAAAPLGAESEHNNLLERGAV